MVPQLKMYSKDEIFFRTIWTNLKAQFSSNRIDDRSFAAFRKERQANLTAEGPPGKNAKNETSFATVAFLVVFFVVLFWASMFAFRRWWCAKQRRNSHGRRRLSSVGSKRQKCRRKYEKVELVDKAQVHSADTLPVKRSRLSSKKSRTTRSRKGLEDENSDDCDLDDGVSEERTEVEVCAAPSSRRRSDLTASASVKTPIENPRSECQFLGKLPSVRTETSERRRGTDTVGDSSETCQSELEDANLAGRDDSEISATEDTTNGRRTNTSTLEAECNDSKCEENDSNRAERSDGEYGQPKSFQKASDKSPYQLVFNAASDDSTNEEQMSVVSGTVASNSEYCVCSIEEDDASANNTLFSTPATISVLPVDITDSGLDTVERKRRFDKIVAALPIGYCVRKQLERGFSNLQRTMSPSSVGSRPSSRTKTIGSRQSLEKPAQRVGKNGSDRELCCAAPVCVDGNSMSRKLVGQTPSRSSSRVSKNSSVERNLPEKTKDSTSRSSSSSIKRGSQRSEEYCRCGSGNSDANS